MNLIQCDKGCENRVLKILSYLQLTPLLSVLYQNFWCQSRQICFLLFIVCFVISDKVLNTFLYFYDKLSSMVVLQALNDFLTLYTPLGLISKYLNKHGAL